MLADQSRSGHQVLLIYALNSYSYSDILQHEKLGRTRITVIYFQLRWATPGKRSTHYKGISRCRPEVLFRAMGCIVNLGD
jgi:hypothetical protein